MADFTAQSVSALKYDFTTFPQDGNTGQRCTGKGVVPEPSTDALNALFETMQEIQAGAFEGKSEDADTAAQAAASRARVCDALSKVCSGKPSVEELSQLPPRILAKFANWLMGELVPKA